MCQDVLTIEMLARDLEIMSEGNVVLSRMQWDKLLTPQLLQYFRMRLIDYLKDLKKIKEIEEAFKMPINEIMEDFFNK